MFEKDNQSKDFLQVKCKALLEKLRNSEEELVNMLKKIKPLKEEFKKEENFKED